MKYSSNLQIRALKRAQKFWRQFQHLTIFLYTAISSSSEASAIHREKMQRQKSLLSFFQKSPSDYRSSDGGASSIGERLTCFPPKPSAAGLEQPAIQTTAHSSLEIRGTDTPPEKVPRQILPAIEKNRGSSLFSSIMHKFVRVDDKRKANER